MARSVLEEFWAIIEEIRFFVDFMSRIFWLIRVIIRFSCCFSRLMFSWSWCSRSISSKICFSIGEILDVTRGGSMSGEVARDGGSCVCALGEVACWRKVWLPLVASRPRNDLSLIMCDEPWWSLKLRKAPLDGDTPASGGCDTSKFNSPN